MLNPCRTPNIYIQYIYTIYIYMPFNFLPITNFPVIVSIMKSKTYQDNPKNPQPRFSLLPRLQRPVSTSSKLDAFHSPPLSSPFLLLLPLSFSPSIPVLSLSRHPSLLHICILTYVHCSFKMNCISF